MQCISVSVSSWEGGKSTLDQEVIHERRKERKRTWEDEYEGELDRGKVCGALWGQWCVVGSVALRVHWYVVDKKYVLGTLLEPYL